MCIGLHERCRFWWSESTNEVVLMSAMFCSGNETHLDKFILWAKKINERCVTHSALLISQIRSKCKIYVCYSFLIVF